MNALRNHVLHEVAQLDLKSLLALEPLLAALKKPTMRTLSTPKRGIAAARCRQILANLKGNACEPVF